MCPLISPPHLHTIQLKTYLSVRGTQTHIGALLSFYTLEKVESNTKKLLFHSLISLTTLSVWASLGYPRIAAEEALHSFLFEDA